MTKTGCDTCGTTTRSPRAVQLGPDRWRCGGCWRLKVTSRNLAPKPKAPVPVPA